MKKYLMLIAAAMLFTTVSGAAVQIGESTIVYGIVDGNCIISNVTGVGDLTIPDKIENCSVKTICGNAFAGNDALKSITLPSEINTIGNSAFRIPGDRPRRGIDFIG